MNFEKLFGQQVFKEHNCNPFQSSSSLSIHSSFAFVLLFISSFYVLSSYCLVIVSLSLVVVSNFEKFRDAAPLRAERTLVIPPSLILLVVIVLF